MNLVELDTLRADLMRCMLNETGRESIWLYDVTPIRTAYRLACYDQNYDGIKTNADGIAKGCRYALTGPGIEDSPFDTPAELCQLVGWVCAYGYLSCYTAETWRWEPHLDTDMAALREWQRVAKITCPTCNRRYPYGDPREMFGVTCFSCLEEQHGRTHPEEDVRGDRSRA